MCVANARRASDDRGIRVCGTLGLKYERMRIWLLMLMLILMWILILMRGCTYKRGRRLGISSARRVPPIRWQPK